MKNFYMKYKNQIGVIVDIIIVILGLYIKNYVFAVLGAALLALTLYIAKLEKKHEEEQAKIAAEKRALKAQQKHLNRGKKKKKKKKR